MPVFCVDVVSPVAVVPLVRLLVDVLPVEVAVDAPVPVVLVELPVCVEVPVGVPVLVPLVDALLLVVVLLEEVELLELSGELLKMTERRSISMR